jgi:Zn-dependent protease
MSQHPLDYEPPPRRRRQQLPTSGIPLFRLFGIQVYLHWAWFLVVIYLVQARQGGSSSILWNLADVLALFGIVLIHEFGHALACRSVGGQADRIMLWPLGGVAFVNPPRRPGAVLWAIAAGPLVNVILVPITFAAVHFVGISGVGPPELYNFLYDLRTINLALLIFNMLPIYPLDGGQILQALLWFIVGEGRSLMIASIIGLIGAAGGLALAVYIGDIWLIVIALFAATQSFGAFKRSRLMAAREQPTIRGNARCPACGAAPPVGPYWGCTCGKSFDVFENRGTCPNCGGAFAVVPCPHCRQSSAPFAWFTPTTPAAPIASRPSA